MKDESVDEIDNSNKSDSIGKSDPDIVDLGNIENKKEDTPDVVSTKEVIEIE